MLIELTSWCEHIDDHVRYRIFIDVEPVFAEAILNKGHQRRPVIQRSAYGVVIVAIARDKAVSALKKDPPGVILGQ